jgi:hypothetical protein
LELELELEEEEEVESQKAVGQILAVEERFQ